MSDKSALDAILELMGEDSFERLPPDPNSAPGKLGKYANPLAGFARLLFMDMLEGDSSEEIVEDEGTKALPMPQEQEPEEEPQPAPWHKEMEKEGKNVTRNFRDRLGRRVCIQNGERVACHGGEANITEPREPGEDEEGGNPRGHQGEFPAEDQPQTPIPRRLTMENIDTQDPDISVVIWTDVGGFAEIANPDSWGKFARWVTTMEKNAPHLAAFTKEGWTDEPGSVLNDFSQLPTKSDEPAIDNVTHEILNSLQENPGAKLAVITVASELPEQSPEPEPESPPAVGPSPFKRK